MLEKVLSSESALVNGWEDEIRSLFCFFSVRSREMAVAVVLHCRL